METGQVNKYLFQTFFYSMEEERINYFKNLKYDFANCGGNLDKILEEVGIRKGEKPLESYISDKQMEKLINVFEVLLGRGERFQNLHKTINS